MAKYRKRPIVIEAEQWFPGKRVNGVLTTDMPDCPIRWLDEYGHAFPMTDQDGWIGTLEGGLHVSPGDWIIVGVKGEVYPCKDDIFKATYEPA